MTRRLARPEPVRRLLLELADEAERMAKAAREAAETYPWSYYASIAPTIGETAGSKPGHTDQTGDVATSKAGMRQAVRKATTKIIAGTSRFMEARDILDDALERTDRHPIDGTRTTPFPRIVTEDELRVASEAAVRRAARGGGFGES